MAATLTVTPSAEQATDQPSYFKVAAPADSGFEHVEYNQGEKGWTKTGLRKGGVEAVDLGAADPAEVQKFLEAAKPSAESKGGAIQIASAGDSPFAGLTLKDAGPLTGHDDLGSTYQAYRQTASADDVIARMQERVAARAAAKGTGAGAQPAAGDAATGAADDAGGTLPNGRASLATPIMLAPGSGETFKDTLRDAGKGVIEGSRQALGGVSDAVHNAFTAADHLAGWLNDHVADLTMPGTGVEAIDTPLRAAAGKKNEIAPAASVTGGVIRDVSRFLTSFGLLRGAGAGAVAATVGAGGADALTREPTEDNLANLLKDHAGLKDPVTTFMAASPNDPEALARFKKGLEGLGLGAAGEGLAFAVRAIKAARAAGKPANDIADALAAQRAQHGEVTDRDFLVLGDPNKPLIEPAVAPPASANAKLAAAKEATAEAGPTAQKLSTLATRAQRAQAAMDGAEGAPRTLDELERTAAEDAAAGHKAILDTIDELKAGPQQQAGGLTSFLVRNGGVKNDGGEVSHIIGSKGKTRPGLISGKGMSLDDAALKAWEEGYFPELGERPTINEFLDALRGDHDTSAPRFHQDDWAAREHQRYLESFTQQLEEAGIDWRNADRTEIARQLDAVADRDAAATPARTEADLAKQEGEMPTGIRPADLGGNTVKVNFARIQSADDVKAVMGAMADHFAPQIDKARRGIQTNEETAKLADELGMSVADLLARRVGQPLNAEQTLAARQLWAASAEKLLETARLAARPNAGEIDQFNFRKMMATHYAIQAEVLGARAETARALQSWSMPAGGSIERARAVQQAVASMGGPSYSKQMAQRLTALADAGVPADGINTFVRRSAMATTLGAVQEAWINALLSNPKTHIVNMTSNWVAAVQQIYERQVAERVSALRGSDGVAPGEAGAMAYGLVTGLKDAFRLAWQSLKSGDGVSAIPGKVEGAGRDPSISSQAFRIGSETGLGRAVDFIGQTARVPGQLLGAEDAFFKSIGYRMEVHAQSLRQATREGLEGEALYQRIAALANDPPEHIRLAAADAALYSTFTNQTGKFGESLMYLRNNVPLAAFVLPFVKTPTNITRYAFERSPIAPLVGQWRDDIAAGGARADVALARIATGSSIMALAADYASSGLISGAGPKDPGEREALQRQGWKPYSVRIGGHWYEYNRLDPFGMLMGFSADVSELVQRSDIHPEQLDEANEIIGAGIAAVAHTVINKTYMQSTAQFFQMMEDGERYAPDYIQQFVGSFVPAIVGAAKNLDDPTQRQAMKLWDAARAKIPEWEKTLSTKVDLWGQTMAPASGYGRLYDVLSPVAASPVKDSPIDAELSRLGFGPERIQRHAHWDGVDVNFRDWPEVYEHYQRLAGNDLKLPQYGDKGAKDMLDQVVKGRGDFAEIYKLGQDSSRPDDGGKAQFIQQRINEYRKASRQAIEADPKFAAFKAMLDQGRAQQMQKRAPAGVTMPVMQ